MNDKVYSLWTNEELETLKKFSGTMSFKQMALEHFANRTPISLQKKAIKLGLESEYRFTKNDINKDFYNVPNLLNCYYAGNFAADGYIQYRGNSMLYVLQVNTKDLEILENFKRDTGFTGPIRSYQRKNYKKETLKNVSYLSITNAKDWITPLQDNFGIIPQKTSRLVPPKLNDENLINAYIIGYLDGDGSIILQQDGKITTLNRLGIRFYSSNLKILSWIEVQLLNILKKYNYTINTTIHNNLTTNGCYEYSIYGRGAAIIYNHLKDINIPKLNRKWNNPEVLDRLEKYKIKYPNLFSQRTNSLEKNKQFAIIDVLNSNKIEFHTEKDVIIIPSKSLAIKILNLETCSEISQHNKNFNKILFNEYKDKDIRLIQIWENELLEKPKIVKTRIKAYLNLIPYNLYARKCKISEISGELKNKFLNKYHIQGQDYGSSINLGLFYKEKLVAVMSFLKRKGDKNYELSRFSGNTSFNVCGGASKLLSYFEKTYSPNSIVSFADKRWSGGNIYFKLNFELGKETPPSYYYFKVNDRKLRHKFGFRHKHLIKKLENYDSNLTEWQNMKNNGWYKIWDCGLMKFEKKCNYLVNTTY